MSTRTPSRPNTPGAVGYVAGVGISCAVFAVLLVAPALRFYDLGDALAVLMIYVPLGGVAAATVGAAVWAPGVLLLHLACRRAPSQLLHVAVAGLAGIAFVLPLLRTTGLERLGEAGPAYLVIAVGVAAASGRLAVIPLVRARRCRVSDQWLGVSDPQDRNSS